MSIRLDKPWRGVDEIESLGGQLGVFELGNAEGEVLYVGFAGGRSLFGLREVVEQTLAEVEGAVGFRVEITTAYRTRYQELLMVHVADHGGLPSANPPEPALGKLSPA